MDQFAAGIIKKRTGLEAAPCRGRAEKAVEIPGVACKALRRRPAGGGIVHAGDGSPDGGEDFSCPLRRVAERHAARTDGAALKPAQAIDLTPRRGADADRHEQIAT